MGLLIAERWRRNANRKSKSKGMDIAVCRGTSPLREITCRMGSHSVIWHPAEVTFPPIHQLRLILDLATPEGCKAELTKLVVTSQNSLPAKDGHLSEK